MLFTTPQLTEKELQVLQRIEDYKRQLSYTITQSLRWTGLLRRSTFARCIQGSNSIEGYNVSVEDAIAAVEGEMPLEAEEEAWMAVTGYRDAMTYVLQLATDPHFTYSASLIKSLHFMMLRHDLTKHPGTWRPGTIFVRNDLKGEIVYEGPDVNNVPSLIDEMVTSLNKDNSDVHVIVRAAMGHLNLVMIHPFSDGNGRMARCLQSLILAREGILAAPFSSIEEYLGRNTPAYYDVLGIVGGGSWHPERDATPWVRFTLMAHFRQAETLLRRMKEIGLVWNALENKLAQQGLPDRAIFALSDAAFGYRIRNSTYRKVAEISENLASHDLKALVEAGYLIPEGERRGRCYAASPLLKQMRTGFRVPRSEEDPFADTTVPISSTNERQPLLPL